MVESPSPKKHQPKDFLAAIWLHRAKIALVAVLGAVSGAVYTIVVPPVYNASAVYVFPVNPAAPIVPIPGMATPLTLLKGILKSPPVNMALSKKYKMPVEDVNNLLGVLERSEENQVVISVPTEKKEWGVQFLNDTIAEVDKVTNRIGFSIAQRQFNAVEGTLNARVRDLSVAENRLTEFIRNSRTAPRENASVASDLASQYITTLRDLSAVNEELESRRSKALDRASESNLLLPQGEVPGQPTSLREQLRQDLLRLRATLQERSQVLGPEAPEIQELQNRIQVTDQNLRRETQRLAQSRVRAVDATIAELEVRRRNLESQRTYLEGLRKVAPGEQLEFVRLSREVQTLGATVQNLRTQLETARVAAEVEQVRWSLLQRPYVDPKPINKGIVRMPAIFMILAVGIYCFLLFFSMTIRERMAMTA